MTELLQKLNIPFNVVSEGRIWVGLAQSDWDQFGLDPFDLPKGWDWESEDQLVRE